MKQNVINRIVFVLLLIIGVGIATWSLLYFFDKPLVEYNNLPYKVQEKVVYPGDIITFEVDFCVKKDTPYSFTQMFYNIDTGEEYYLPHRMVAVHEGCAVVTSTPKEIPDYVSEGNYILKFELYIPGRFRTHTVEAETTVFEVMNQGGRK